MAAGMMSCNLSIHYSLTVGNILPVFAAAYLVGYIAVNRITVKLTQKVIPYTGRDEWIFPVIKVIFMVICMSFIGPLIEAGLQEDPANAYLNAVSRNYFMTLLRQLLMAGPLLRKFLKVTSLYRIIDCDK